MNIITQLLDKALYMMFFMSIFYIGRHIFLFSRHLKKPEPEKYTLPKQDLLYLAISLAFIIMTIFKGINI